jgi:hypothetical protein
MSSDLTGFEIEIFAGNVFSFEMRKQQLKLILTQSNLFGEEFNKKWG